jgi:hypothetical protein
MRVNDDWSKGRPHSQIGGALHSGLQFGRRSTLQSVQLLRSDRRDAPGSIARPSTLELKHLYVVPRLQGAAAAHGFRSGLAMVLLTIQGPERL